MALPNIANLYNLSRPTSKKVASIDYFFLQISQYLMRVPRSILLCIIKLSATPRRNPCHSRKLIFAIEVCGTLLLGFFNL